MVIEIDNKDCINLKNNQSASYRIRHIDAKKNYLRKLKEGEVIMLSWCLGDENSSDLFAKNLEEPAFNKHSSKYIDEGVN